MKIKAILFFLLAISFSCSDDVPEKCIQYKPENVTEVNAPFSGKKNEQVEIEVNFVVYNGCGKFEKFIESGSEQSKIIEVLTRYEGCICTQNIPIITDFYKFTPSTTGVYELRFKSGETDYITVNITIMD